MMKTPICPPCGCSLVRLGIPVDNAVHYSYDGGEYLFCCQGCLELFAFNPNKYIEEVRDLIVCPACLAEKSLQQTVIV